MLEWLQAYGKYWQRKGLLQNSTSLVLKQSQHQFTDDVKRKILLIRMKSTVE